MSRTIPEWSRAGYNDDQTKLVSFNKDSLVGDMEAIALLNAERDARVHREALMELQEVDEEVLS